MHRVSLRGAIVITGPILRARARTLGIAFALLGSKRRNLSL